MTLSIDNELPEWSPLPRPSGRWTWDRGCLVEEGANYLGHPPPKRTHFLAHFVVSYIYGRQNRAPPVRETVQSPLSRLAPGRYGLSFGSGQVDFGPRILNLDVGTELVVDILSVGTLEIPLLDSSLYLVISQEVLEHVRNPSAALREFHRVLAPGGELVLQLPFIIGYHPGPEDLCPFSVEAYAQLLPSEDWEIPQKRISVGRGTGLPGILTEFCSIQFSAVRKSIVSRLKWRICVVVFTTYRLRRFDSVSAREAPDSRRVHHYGQGQESRSRGKSIKPGSVIVISSLPRRDAKYSVR